MSLETPRTFTQEQAQAMYLFIEKLAQVSLLANPMTGGVYPLGVEARELLQAIATPASENAASADGVAGRMLQNRNTEQFESAEEYHTRNFYAYPVTYHNREILNWQIYDKYAEDKNVYCVHSNIRSRADAIAQVDYLQAEANAAARALNAGTQGPGE